MSEQQKAQRSQNGPELASRRLPRERKRPHSANRFNDNLVVTAEIVPLALPQDATTIRRDRVFVRIIQPYPWSFTTHAKRRWLGRRLQEVYSTEFGAYPSSYYDAAIRQGRILVNDNKVDPDYLIKDNDVLSHCVHRHEPAVAVASPDKAVVIVAETDELVVVDKPPTMPIHSCGGYHKNTLIEILDGQQKSKHYNIHRLDRLTSGLVLMAKTSDAARKYITVMQQQRDSCEKLYLARVRGRFATNLPDTLPRSHGDKVPVYGEWPDKQGREQNAFGYWISMLDGQNCSEVSLEDFARRESPLHTWLRVLGDRWNGADSPLAGHEVSMQWLHVACPTRIEQHKNGVCACGQFLELDNETYGRSVKSAETSFALVHYDQATDSSLVLCRPKTGRSHQIRLHLQLLGNPIANDPNYGGFMWWNDEVGKNDCQLAQSLLNAMDSVVTVAPVSSQPAAATQAEVDELNSHLQATDEPLDVFIQRTCVWCKRGQGCTADRSILEYLTRSLCIYLHAIQYSFRSSTAEGVSFRTEIPGWAKH